MTLLWIIAGASTPQFSKPPSSRLAETLKPMIAPAATRIMLISNWIV